MPEISDHLRGPWQAVLVHKGTVIDSPDKLPPDAVVSISIRRGNALPVAIDGDVWLPEAEFRAGDVIEPWGDEVYVVDGDPSTDAPARWAQAQAMAAGLNGDPERMRDMIRSAIALTKSTDGNALNPDEKIPVGELQRILHVDAGCSIETNQFGVPL